MTYTNMAPLWALLSGALFFLVRACLPRQVRFQNTSLLTVIFVVLAIFFLWLAPSGDQSLEATGVLAQSGLDRVLITIFLTYMSLAFLNIWRERTIEDLSEINLAHLVFSALGVAVLSANHMAVILVTLPTLVLMVFSSPRLVRQEYSSDQFVSGLYWFLAFGVLLFGISLVWANTGSPFLWTDLRRHVFQSTDARSVFLIWTLMLLPTMLLLFLGAGPILSNQFERAKRWSLVAAYKWSLLLLGGLWVLRWFFLFRAPWTGEQIGFPSGFEAQEILLVTTVVGALIVSLLAAITRRISVWCGWLAIQPILGAVVCMAIGTQDSLIHALGAFSLMAIGVPYLCRWFIDNELHLNASLSEASEVIRRTSTPRRILLLFTFLVLSPLGSFSSVLALTAPFALGSMPSVSGPLRVVLAFFLLPLFLFVGQVVTARSPYRPDRALTLGQRVFSYTSLAAVILLGLYPWPLYNYLVSYFRDNHIW